MSSNCKYQLPSRSAQWKECPMPSEGSLAYASDACSIQHQMTVAFPRMLVMQEAIRRWGHQERVRECALTFFSCRLTSSMGMLSSVFFTESIASFLARLTLSCTTTTWQRFSTIKALVYSAIVEIFKQASKLSGVFELFLQSFKTTHFKKLPKHHEWGHPTPIWTVGLRGRTECFWTRNIVSNYSRTFPEMES
jgi:hypothetical protein